MKLAYLTEVAALISAHCHLLIEQPGPLSNQVLGDFYIHSRNRFNRWLRDLNDIESGVEIRDPLHLIGLNPVRPSLQSIAEQILLNDLLNRVWCVTTIACDRQRGEDRAESLMQNVFRGHEMVRRKALDLCMEEDQLTVEQAMKIECLRSSAERWSDLLCCLLMARYDLWDYAWNEKRAREFHSDRFDQETLKPRSHVWTLILAGLRHSFPDVEGLGAPLHEDDRIIARCMLDAFPRGAGNMAIWSGPTLAQVRS